jgi:HNH endonuclease
MLHTDYLLIPLRRHDRTLRAHAIIDVANAHLAEHRWCLDGHAYAMRRGPKVNGRRATFYLHREVLGLAAGDPREGDHVDGNPLNCRRSNLRVATGLLNAQNRPSHRGSTSAYRGVTWFAPQAKWRARAMINSKAVFLGYFTDELEAAEVASAYRLAHMPFTNENRRLRGRNRT